MKTKFTNYPNLLYATFFLLIINQQIFAQICTVAPSINYAGVPTNFCVNSSITTLTPINTGGIPTSIGLLSSTNSQVTTLTGSTEGFADGTLATAMFNQPRGVAIDALGNIFVADTYAHKIRKITALGVVSTLAGSVGGFLDGIGAAAQFNYPYNLALDAVGNIYVADQNNCRIRKITPLGLVTTIAGNGIPSSVDGVGTAAQFYLPYGIAIDGSNNIFVSELFGHKIRKITPSGVVTTLAGNGVSGFADGNGTASQFSFPFSIITDAMGNIYVADAGNNKIRKVTPTGMVTTIAGNGIDGFADGVSTSAQFSAPVGLANDAIGNIFVTDANNHRIRKISPSGVVTTLAGSCIKGFADGIGQSAKFNNPQSIALDEVGNIFIADPNNNRIRKISGAKFTISPILPAGLNFDGSTGAISGTPSAASPTTTYTIAASNACGSGSTTIFFSTDASSALATVNTTQTLNLVGTTVFNNNCNNLIATVAINCGNTISGSTVAKVWIEPTQPVNYVKRHFEITPAANAATSSATITLYATQAEFDAFNAVNVTKLPTSATDLAGISNLLIEKRSGVSSNGTGLPSTYTGAITTLNPTDASIVWNSAGSRWEISFDVTDFSGFFIKTQLSVLPINWLSVSGKFNTQKQVEISWEVQEKSITSYNLEKSIDGIYFESLGAILSKGDGVNNYRYKENNNLVGTAFYRIKQLSINGQFGFSNIIKLSSFNNQFISVYPNPVKDLLTISLNNEFINSTAMLTDITGKVLKSFVVTQSSFTLNLNNYAKGIYLLKFKGGKTQKVVKQ